jgi:hypothetical protein
MENNPLLSYSAFELFQLSADERTLLAKALSAEAVASSILREDDVDAADSASPLPWELVKNALISPPICVKGRTYLRLALDLKKLATLQPPRDAEWTGQQVHLPVYVLPPILTSAEYEDPLPQGGYVCIVGVPFLGQIVALWDTIASVGIQRAIDARLITASWADNVLTRAGCNLHRAAPGRIAANLRDMVPPTFTRVAARMDYLLRVAEARGITPAAIRGETSSDRGGRRWNSWFQGDICECCGTSVRTPSRRWPNSQARHIHSFKHQKNALIFLLREFGQGGGA